MCSKEIVMDSPDFDDQFRDLKQLMKGPGNPAEGVTQLHRMARSGQIKAVQTILARGNDAVNARTNTQGYTPLHFAATSGCSNTCKILINHQADVNAVAGLCLTPLRIACANLDGHVALNLIAMGAIVDTPHFGKGGLLHLLAKSRKTEIIHALLSYGVDVDEMNSHRMTALHIATALDNLNVVRLLVRQGAGVNKRFNAYNRRLGSQYCDLTALHVAAAKGFEGILLHLIAAQAEIDAQTKDGMTPLHFCCQTKNHQFVRDLIFEGANVNARDSDGFTPIHYAATFARRSVIKLLVENGANINEQSRNGNTPLHLAALGGYLKTVMVLRERKARVDLVNSMGHGVIYCAIMGGNVMVVTYLLQEGADACLPDFHSWTSLHHAGFAKLKDIGVQMLIDNGANVNVTTIKLWTPLHCAAYWNSNKMAEVLIRNNANVNAVGGNGCTPLHLAVRRNSEEVAELLLNNGADANAVDNMGWTCLHSAAHRGYEDVVKLLLKPGRATADPVTYQGISPLHFAVKFHHVPCVDLLLKSGADVNRELEGGVTPIHLAAHFNNKYMVFHLLLNNAYFDMGVDGDHNKMPILAAIPNHNLEMTRLFVAIHKVFIGVTDTNMGSIIVKNYLMAGGPASVASWQDGSLFSKAVACGSDGIVDLMLSRRVNTGLVNADGMLPMHYAAINNRYDICAELLSFSFDSKSGEKNMTPMQMAAEEGHLRMKRLLRAVNRNFEFAEKGVVKGVKNLNCLKVADLQLFRAVINATKCSTGKNIRDTASDLGNRSYVNRMKDCYILDGKDGQ